MDEFWISGTWRDDGDDPFVGVSRLVETLRGRLILLENADELRVLEHKRGSRRGYYPRDEA